MCEYCMQYECPSSCPNFDGYISAVGTRLGECNNCEQGIYENEKHYKKNGKILCSECAEELIPPDLLDFLDCDSIDDFFDMLY